MDESKQPTQTGENRRPKGHRKPGWKRVFLLELEKWGVVDFAIRQAGVVSSTAYEAREKDAKFRADWDEAEGKLLATAEVVARQRALTGTQRPVFYLGQQVASVTEVDNLHLRWLLAKLKPSVYGDKLEVTRKNEGTIKIEVEVTLPDNGRGDATPTANGHRREPAERG